MKYLTEAGKAFKSKFGQGTTVPKSKWNPIKTGGGLRDREGNIIPLGTDARLDPQRANRGFVNPRGNDMTTIDPGSGLPMTVVRGIARADARRNEP